MAHDCVPDSTSLGTGVTLRVVRDVSSSEIRENIPGWRGTTGLPDRDGSGDVGVDEPPAFGDQLHATGSWSHVLK